MRADFSTSGAFPARLTCICSLGHSRGLADSSGIGVLGEFFQGADHPHLVFLGDMGVDHRCLYVRMSEQLLDGPDITTGLDQVGSKAVPLMPDTA